MDKKDQDPYINVDYFESLTGDIPQSEKIEPEEIGEQVKILREKKGLSIDELSKVTGFNTELLSKIEKNEVQPQLGTIIKLSKALDSAFGRIVSGIGDKPYAITRKNEQKAVHRSTSQKGKKKLYSYKSLAPEVEGRHMEALIVELEKNTNGETSVHDGEEFIYVLDGTAVLKIGKEQYELESGDSVYYLSTTPHMVSAKDRRTTILAVIYGG